jgi:hypothetical protein
VGEEPIENRQKAEEARRKGSTGRDSRFGLARPVPGLRADEAPIQAEQHSTESCVTEAIA